MPDSLRGKRKDGPTMVPIYVSRTALFLGFALGAGVGLVAAGSPGLTVLVGMAALFSALYVGLT